MIIVDTGRMFQIIRDRRPTSVSLNGPDGMLPQVQDAALAIAEKFGIPAYVIADATWGACDLNAGGARTLGADIHFNIGHTINSETIPGSGNTILIDAFDDVPFDKVAAKCARRLRGRTISLVTDSQHLHQMGRVRRILEEQGGIRVVIGGGGGQLNDGQVFGCEFYPAREAAAAAEAHAFLGQSSFHAAGVALSTGLPTYILDPYFNEIRDITDFAQKLQKKATLAIYKAAEAGRFGVIVGLKEGQLSKTFALRIKRELEAAGKHVQLFAMTDITGERLANIRGVDAFVQAACPRISTDNPFERPVLSTPQAGALLRVLRGEEPGEYLQVRHWL